MSSRSLLALGDSYTIGEGLPVEQNFPNQVIQRLNKQGYDFDKPVVIAKTGWTTDELQDEINKQNLENSYDFVTLLIGVNNQYRGSLIEEYKVEFEQLLKLAIDFAGERGNRVIVISIPDWGVTPFAKDRDRELIAKQIDDYNNANFEIATNYKVHYLDITPGTREAESDLSLLTSDGLHPSVKEYTRWAEMISDIISKEL